MGTHKTEDNALLNAALRYAEQGYPVVPLHATHEGLCTCRNKSCPSKGKHPRTKHGITDATTDPVQIRAYWERWPDANIGLVTGKRSGLGVLDVDTKKGKRGDLSLAALLEEHGPLPPTLKAVTPSGGEHYFWKWPKKALRSRMGGKDGPMAGLDLLGEGSYVVAAPSEIDEKAYGWDVAMEPSPCPAWLLEVWEKGSSPENRITTLIKEILPGGKERKGNWLVRCPFPPHEDKTPSFEVRLRDGVYHCWSCGQKGSIEDLYAHMKQITKEEARRILYPPPAHIQELNQIHAVITDFSGQCVILNESEDPQSKWKKITLSSLGDLRGRYGSRPPVVVGRKWLSVADAWFNHRDRREYREIRFVPGKPTPPGYYNLWQGWPLKPCPGECQRFLELISEIICSGDPKLNEYVLNWMALAVQRPWEKPEVALVLRGNEGVGKGKFAKYFGKLFGPNFKHLNNARQLVGNFNAHLANAMLVYADEAFLASDPLCEGPLKTLITEETFPLEYKGKDIVMVENYIHLIIASNHDWVVPAGARARRFCAIDVSEAVMQNTEYFSAIDEQMCTGGLEGLFHFLLHRDIRHFQPRTIPVTKALTDMKMFTMAGTPFEFWYSILQRRHLGEWDREWQGRVAKAELQRQYGDWMKGQPRRATETQLGMALKKICPHVRDCWIRDPTDTRGVKGWDFGDLETCRTAFCRHYGWGTHDWGDADESVSSTPTGPDNSVGPPPVSAVSEASESLVEDLDWETFQRETGDPAEVQTPQGSSCVEGGDAETPVLERGG